MVKQLLIQGGVQGVSLEPSSLPPVFKYCMKMK